nr:ribonuclease H-like domain-containing protein [Tanacetum cinerariifolium]
MLDEYNALITNGAWVLVPRPDNVNIGRSMWLFRHKFHAYVFLSRYKARLVVKGRSKQQGIDCDETFSLVVKQPTIRTTAYGMFLSQSIFAKEILERAHMQKCNSCNTPVDTELKLGPDGDPISDLTLYRNLDGDLQLGRLPYYSSVYLRAEAVYHGVANVVAKTAWICNLLRELHAPIFIATL